MFQGQTNTYLLCVPVGLRENAHGEDRTTAISQSSPEQSERCGSGAARTRSGAGQPAAAGTCGSATPQNPFSSLRGKGYRVGGVAREGRGKRRSEERRV